MAGVKEIYRRLLSRYETSPLACSIHLFCVVGNGYEWNAEGNLFANYRDDSEYVPTPSREHLTDSKELQSKFRLEDEAKALRRKFVIDNLEELLTVDPTTSLWRPDTSFRGYYEDNPCTKYALMFTYPDNVQQDWARVLYSVSHWWTVHLRHAYGVSHNGKFFGPTVAIQQAYELLNMHHERTERIMNGWTEEQQREHHAEINRLVSDMMKRAGVDLSTDADDEEEALLSDDTLHYARADDGRMFGPYLHKDDAEDAATKIHGSYIALSK